MWTRNEEERAAMTMGFVGLVNVGSRKIIGYVTSRLVLDHGRQQMVDMKRNQSPS